MSLVKVHSVYNSSDRLSVDIEIVLECTIILMFTLDYFYVVHLATHGHHPVVQDLFISILNFEHVYI